MGVGGMDEGAWKSLQPSGGKSAQVSWCILLGNQLCCETRAVELLLDQVGSQGVRTPALH